MNRNNFFFLLSLLLISCTKEQKEIIPTATESEEIVSFQEIDSDSIIYSVLKIDSLALVDYYKIDLNNDQLEDLVILQNPPKYQADPGTFSRLTVYLANNGTKSFDPVDIFDVIPDDFSSSATSLIDSKLVGIYPTQTGVLIFAFGYPYGSGRSTSLVIKVSGKSINTVFEGDYNYFISLSKLNQTPTLVLRKTAEHWGWVDSLNILLSSYCPYQVVTLNETFKFDSVLTKDYNIENYVFQGYEPYNSKITVAIPKDGAKPYLYQAN